MAQICVDASLVLSWLIPVQRSRSVIDFWSRISDEQTDLCGPPLLFSEVSSALRLRVYLAELTPDEGERLLDTFFALGIVESNPPGLTRRAWELAKQFNHPRAYDAQYIALAEIEGCEFWTADARLYNSLRGLLPWVNLADGSR